MLSLCCCSGSSLVCGEQGGDSLVALHRLFTAVAPHVAGFPSGLDGKESAFQRGRPGFDPWVRKIPWRREWLPTLVFLPGEFHGQRNPLGYSPWGRQELDMTEQLSLSLSLVAKHRV